MSKIGKIPIVIPENVTVSIEARGSQGTRVTVAGKKGELSRDVKKEIEVKLSEGKILVEKRDNSRFARALQGTIRSLLSNMIKGVTGGFERQLVLHGVGFRARVEGDQLVLSVGFSHPVVVKAPNGVTFSVTEDRIIITGIDKQLVGEQADKIRRVKKPEPYKGKGIRYLNERIRRKVGKKAVATA